MTDTAVLSVILHGRSIAEIVQLANKRHELRYHSDWRSDPRAHPLSLSMPLSQEQHGERTLFPFLWGLLPDSAQTLRHFARTYGVSERNPIGLLKHLGEDCAGAAQFVVPEHVDELTGLANNIDAEWIDEREVAAKLRIAMQTGMPALTPQTFGRFSLAGAQPKIALLRHEGRWGIPKGRTPTTHILKPPSPSFPGFAENEHLCLQLAQALGLRAANTTVTRFDDQLAVVVERFDRALSNGAYSRLHQEDVCQAFGVSPDKKYEADGGPGLLAIFRFIDESSVDPQGDRLQFLDAAILNWVLAATDAHAKNFSFLHDTGSRVRLAPFYDVASYLPFAESPWHEVRLAMRVHNEYLVKKITLNDWLRLGRKAAFDDDLVVERLRSVCARIPDATSGEVARARKAGVDPAHLARLGERIIARASECATRIEAGIAPS